MDDFIPILTPFKSGLANGFVTTADQIKGLKEYIDDEIGKLDISTKDMVVSGGQVRELEDDEVIQDTRPQGLYIVLTIANSTNDKLYIPVNQLVDNYIGSDFINIEANRSIHLNLPELAENLYLQFGLSDMSASITALQNTLNQLYSYVNTALSVRYTKVETYSKDEVNTQIANAINEAINDVLNTPL